VNPETQVQEFGYAIIEPLFDSSEIDHLITEIETARLRRSKAGIRHAMHFAPVAKLANDPRLLEIAKGLLGPNACPFRATLFDKSPKSNWLVVWHQDTALPLMERREVKGWGPWSVKDGITYAHAPAHALEKVLAIRVHLDDSHANNGPLRVLPRSHTLGVISDDSIESLVSRSQPVACLVAAGGAILMRPLIVHSSSKSTADEPRRVLHIEYAVDWSIADPVKLAIA
jgi:ectoine hydroxylase-related dioxygenase (phytanoyl-CoA dioxygenase family)